MIKPSKNLQQFSRYAAVGALSATIDLGLLNLLLYFHWPVLEANTVAFVVAVINSFFLNKYWTYNDTTSKWQSQLPFYILIYAVGLGLSNGSIYALNIIMHWNVNLVKILSMAAIIVWNFLAPKFLVFKK